MAGTRTITELPAATGASGADIFPVVQSGTTRKLSITQLFASADSIVQASGKKNIFGGTVAPADPTRHQWFTKDATGTYYEVFALDDTSDSVGNVVAVIPKFLSMGRLGVSGTIEFGPDLGAEAIILGSGTPTFNLLFRVSKQSGSSIINGVHTTNGIWQLARSSDNFVSNSEILMYFRSNGIYELRKQSGLNPSWRWIDTDGTTDLADIYHDGSFRIASKSGALILETDGVTNSVLVRTNATAQVTVSHTATAVNTVNLTGGASGSPGVVTVSAIGSDSHIDIALTPKGTGVVKVGTYSAKAAEAFDGYISIKDAAGNARKLMTCA